MKPLDEETFPQVHNGKSIDEIGTSVRNLYEMAKKLRQKRFENGALQLNQPKIAFELDESFKPVGVALDKVGLHLLLFSIIAFLLFIGKFFLLARRFQIIGGRVYAIVQHGGSS